MLKLDHECTQHKYGKPMSNQKIVIGQKTCQNPDFEAKVNIEFGPKMYATHRLHVSNMVSQCQTKPNQS